MWHPDPGPQAKPTRHISREIVEQELPKEGRARYFTNWLVNFDLGSVAPGLLYQDSASIGSDFGLSLAPLKRQRRPGRKKLATAKLCD
jgi:hypothetical protein